MTRTVEEVLEEYREFANPPMIRLIRALECLVQRNEEYIDRRADPSIQIRYFDESEEQVVRILEGKDE